jgi:hypothetical protein
MNKFFPHKKDTSGWICCIASLFGVALLAYVLVGELILWLLE